MSSSTRSTWLERQLHLFFKSTFACLYIRPCQTSLDTITLGFAEALDTDVKTLRESIPKAFTWAHSNEERVCVDKEVMWFDWSVGAAMKASNSGNLFNAANHLYTVSDYLSEAGPAFVEKAEKFHQWAQDIWSEAELIRKEERLAGRKRKREQSSSDSSEEET